MELKKDGDALGQKWTENEDSHHVSICFPQSFYESSPRLSVPFLHDEQKQHQDKAE